MSGLKQANQIFDEKKEILATNSRFARRFPVVRDWDTQLPFSETIHRVSKKTSTHIIGYKLRNSCPILIIFETKIPHII